MKKRKDLDLKITVTGDDPDGTLGKMLAKFPVGRINLMQLRYSTEALDVTAVEREDGNPIGLESEFESRWAESHCEGDDEETQEKAWAREAFLWGVEYAKENT
jgi:hypothetical protein